MTLWQIINLILKEEGAYVDDPDDLGGETNFGITKRNHPDIDIAALTVKEAKEIYKRDYWEKYHLELYPGQYQWIVFDMIVNQGYRGMSLVLQRAINSKARREVVRVDGAAGRKTRAALWSHKPSIDRIRAYRIKRYIDVIKARPRNEKFFFGWFKRTIRVGDINSLKT